MVLYLKVQPSNIPVDKWIAHGKIAGGSYLVFGPGTVQVFRGIEWQVFKFCDLYYMCQLEYQCECKTEGTIKNKKASHPHLLPQK